MQLDVGFELYGQIFEENDLVGVMNAHAQRASELFLQGTGLGYFVGDNAGYEMPAGWAEMLSMMAGAFGEVVEHAATVRQVADAAEDFPTEFGHSLDGHAELRFQAERSLESMRQRLVGLALAVIGAHADVGDATTVEMADRAAAGVLTVTEMTLQQLSKRSMPRLLLLFGSSSQARSAVLS